MSLRIVLATFGSFGDLHPYLALALELQARGHRPVIATSDRYQAKIAAAGIEFHPVRPITLSVMDERELLRLAMDSRGGPEYVLRKLVLPGLPESYEDTRAACERADLVVSHPLAYSVPILAEKLQLPWVSTVLQPLLFLSHTDPPVLPMAPWLESLYFLGPWFSGTVLTIGKLTVRHWSRPIHEFRKSLGLPATPKNPMFEGQYSPRGNLALFSKLLAAPQPDWPPNTTATGFCFYDRQDHAAGMPAELAAFLAAGPPPIVFTLGTSAVMVAGNFYQESLQAAKQLNRRAVFLIGKDERNQLGPLPDGMVAAEYAPYSDLFPRAAAIVHQGGAGTTGQAMRAGKPSVVVPFSHDQPDHAARLKRLGISETVTRHGYSADRVARALQRVLNNPSYAEQAEAIGRQVRAEDGIKTACDILEANVR